MQLTDLFGHLNLNIRALAYQMTASVLSNWCISGCTTKSAIDKMVLLALYYMGLIVRKYDFVTCEQ